MFAALLLDSHLQTLHFANQLFILLQYPSIVVTLLSNLAQNLRVEEVLQAFHMLQYLEECGLVRFWHVCGVIKRPAERYMHPLAVVIWLRGLNG